MASSAPGPPPDWRAELPSLVHAGLGDEEADAARERLIARMRAAQPSLKAFVEALGPFLTSDLEPQRDRAIALLAECLEALPSLVTSSSDADFLLRFFVARFTDWPANTGAFRGARTLVRRFKVGRRASPPSPAPPAAAPSSPSPAPFTAAPSLSALTACARRLCDEVEARALARLPRQAAIELLLELCRDREDEPPRGGDGGETGQATEAGSSPAGSASPSLPSRLISAGVPLLEAAVAFSDGERDPRCLAASLPLLALSTRATERAESEGDEAAAALLEAYAEDAFEILASYLPVAFARGRDDERARARRGVAAALDRALAGAEVFLPALPALVGEKLLEDAETNEGYEEHDDEEKIGGKPGAASGGAAAGGRAAQGAQTSTPTAGGAPPSHLTITREHPYGQTSSVPSLGRVPATERRAPHRQPLSAAPGPAGPSPTPPAPGPAGPSPTPPAPGPAGPSPTPPAPGPAGPSPAPPAPGPAGPSPAPPAPGPAGPSPASVDPPPFLLHASLLSAPSPPSRLLPPLDAERPPPPCVEIVSPLHRAAASGAFSDAALAPIAPRVFEALRSALCAEGGAEGAGQERPPSAQDSRPASAAGSARGAAGSRAGDGGGPPAAAAALRADCAHRALLAWLSPAHPRTRRALVRTLAASDAVRDARASARDPGTDPTDAAGFSRAARTIAGGARVLEVLAEAGEGEELDAAAEFLLDAVASPSVATRLLAWSALGDLLVAVANGTEGRAGPHRPPGAARCDAPPRAVPLIVSRAFRLAVLEPPEPRAASSGLGGGPQLASASAPGRAADEPAQPSATSPSRPSVSPPAPSRPELASSRFAALLGGASDDLGLAAATARRLGAAAEAALVPGGVAPADRLAAADALANALAAKEGEKTPGWEGPSRGAAEAAAKVLWALARGAAGEGAAGAAGEGPAVEASAPPRAAAEPAVAQQRSAPSGPSARSASLAPACLPSSPSLPPRPPPPLPLAVAAAAAARLVPAACRPLPAGARCAAALRAVAGSWRENAALVADAVDAELLRRLREGRFAEAAGQASLRAEVGRMALGEDAAPSDAAAPCTCHPSLLLRGVVDVVAAWREREETGSAPLPPSPQVEAALLSALFPAVAVAARADAAAPRPAAQPQPSALPSAWPLELLNAFCDDEPSAEARGPAGGDAGVAAASVPPSGWPPLALGFPARVACVVAAGSLAGAGAPRLGDAGAPGSSSDAMAVDGADSEPRVSPLARAARLLARLAVGDGSGGGGAEGAPDAPRRCVASAAAQALATLVAVGAKRAGKGAAGAAPGACDALPAALAILEPLTTRGGREGGVGPFSSPSSLLAWSALGAVLRAALSGGDRRADAALEGVFAWLETSEDGVEDAAAGEARGGADAMEAEVPASPAAGRRAAIDAAVAAVTDLFAGDWKADRVGGEARVAAGAGLAAVAAGLASAPPPLSSFPAPYREAPLWRQRALTALCRYALESAPARPSSVSSSPSAAPAPRCARSRPLRLALAASLCASPPPARGSYAVRAAPWLVEALGEVPMTSPFALPLLQDVSAAVEASLSGGASAGASGASASDVPPGSWPVEPSAARVAAACGRLAFRPAAPRVRVAALAALAALARLPYASVHSAQPRALAAALAARDDDRRPVRAAAVAAAAAWTK